MRLSSILLAAAAIVFVGSGRALSATPTGQVVTSALVLPDLETGHDKRFLRISRERSDNDDGEERTIDMSKLDDLMSDKIARKSAFYKWWKVDITPTDVYNALDLDNFQKYRRIFKKYEDYVERIS